MKVNSRFVSNIRRYAYSAVDRESQNNPITNKTILN